MSTMTTIYLVLGAIFILTLTIGTIIFLGQRFLNPEPSPAQQRLGRLKEKKKEVQHGSDAELKKRVSQYYKKTIEYKNAGLGKFLEDIPFFARLKKSMQQADMTVPMDRYVLLTMILPITLGIILSVVIQQFIFLVLCILGPFGGNFFINLKKQKRLGKFVEQLPDALGLITSSLRAGHSFQSALNVASTELHAPLSTEFSLVVKDTNLGIPVREALGRLSSNLDNIPDVKMFVTAVLIQREAGGNLAEVLDQLGYTIRERFKLKRQISAMTAQSRLTGYLIGSAPIILFIVLNIMNPKYSKPLTETEIGHFLLITAATLQIIGFIIIKQVVNIRV